MKRTFGTCDSMKAASSLSKLKSFNYLKDL